MIRRDKTVIIILVLVVIGAFVFKNQMDKDEESPTMTASGRKRAPRFNTTEKAILALSGLQSFQISGKLQFHRDHEALNNVLLRGGRQFSEIELEKKYSEVVKEFMNDFTQKYGKEPISTEEFYAHIQAVYKISTGDVAMSAIPLLASFKEKEAAPLPPPSGGLEELTSAREAAERLSLDLIAQVDQLRLHNDALKKANDTCEEQLAQMKHKCELQEVENANLREALAEASAQVDRLQARLGDFEAAAAAEVALAAEAAASPPPPPPSSGSTVNIETFNANAPVSFQSITTRLKSFNFPGDPKPRGA